MKRRGSPGGRRPAWLLDRSLRRCTHTGTQRYPDIDPGSCRSDSRNPRRRAGRSRSGSGGCCRKRSIRWASRSFRRPRNPRKSLRMHLSTRTKAAPQHMSGSRLLGDTDRCRELRNTGPHRGPGHQATPRSHRHRLPSSASRCRARRPGIRRCHPSSSRRRCRRLPAWLAHSFDRCSLLLRGRARPQRPPPPRELASASRSL
jgi:hypothetical protein